jgi:hypothetical protein
MNKKGSFSGIFIFAISIIFIVLIFFIFENAVRTCNDGTNHNECSKIKPYFCLKGNLIENASFCGCSEFSEINGDNCLSIYQIGSKEIVLPYTLNGKNGQINFTVYKKLYDYFSKLSRFIKDAPDEDLILLTFKLRSLDDSFQRELLLPLVVEIQNLAKNKDDQARIAISIVQNIPFGNSNKTLRFGGISLEYSRYPYEVLYDMEGVCGEKSELLIFLLREIGYDSAFIYYKTENHEAVGIRCPEEKSLNNTGYCFVETTGPSIITDYKTEYTQIGQLISIPEIIPILGNLTFGEQSDFYESRDFFILDSIRERAKEFETINFIQHLQFKKLTKKYGLKNPNEYSFD